MVLMVSLLCDTCSLLSWHRSLKGNQLTVLDVGLFDKNTMLKELYVI